LTLLAWVAVAAWSMFDRWGQIRWLSLGDTDDNMRLMQVRALLDGQGWYDLRNYRMNPPVGFDIHWSRIVDLPIAGLILFFRLFTSNSWAERLACGIAPLLPLSIAMLGIGATVRRLISPYAWPLAVVIMVGATGAMLTAGETGRDALAGLGLSQGYIGATTGEDIIRTFGLNLTGGMNLGSAEAIKASGEKLQAAMKAVRDAYRALDPTTATANKPVGQAPAYLTAQLANYQAALARLTG